jgi:hypothetical protein
LRGRRERQTAASGEILPFTRLMEIRSNEPRAKRHDDEQHQQGGDPTRDDQTPFHRHVLAFAARAHHSSGSGEGEPRTTTLSSSSKCHPAEPQHVREEAP